MAAVLSPFFMGSPSVKTGGAPNVGGFLYTYVAGTTTPLATYTTSAMSVQNANPLTFNSFGLLSTEIWWPAGSSVKFLVTDSGGSPITTLDNVTGLNDNTVTAGTEWVEFGLTPTYVNSTSFTVPGNQTSILQIGRQLKTSNTAGTVYATISNSVFGALTTVTLVYPAGGTIDSGISSIEYGLLAPTSPSIPTIIGMPTGTAIAYDADYAWMYDASAGFMVKVLMGTFIGTQYLVTNFSANTGTTTVPFLPSGLSASPYSEIVIFFEGVSMSGTDNAILQMIDTTGVVNSGYRSRCMTINNATMSSASFTNGFGISLGNATGTLYGSITLTRERIAAAPGGDTWHINGSLVNGIGTNGQLVLAGMGTLNSATPALKLDGLRLGASGADTFDAGAIWVTGRV